MLHIDNVTKAYMNRKKTEAKIVLDDVSLRIEDNEFVCLIGPSGCGKTTLLNLMAGFERPTKGTITYDDQEILEPSPQRGVVFQEYSLFPWMNVLENIMLALECKGIPEFERKSIAEDALSAVGLTGSGDQRPNLLSGGMKQRVAIARVLAMDPKVMLMDEPFSNLDEQTRNKLDSDVVEIWSKKKKTVIFVTHNVEEAMMIATRIVLFSSSPGKVVKEWTVPEGKRSIDDSKFIELKKEIVGLMDECSCTGPNIITIE